MKSKNILKFKKAGFLEKDYREIDSGGIDSLNEKLNLFIKNGYKIKDKLKILLQKRNKKIMNTTSF